MANKTSLLAGRFVCLRLLDGAAGAKAKELAAKVSRELGIQVAHMEGSVNLCEFNYPENIDWSSREWPTLHSYLHSLYHDYPITAATINPDSAFPPMGC